MYRDKRGIRVVVDINRILNQNARALGAAVFPGMDTKVIDILRKRMVGVLQMLVPK